MENQQEIINITQKLIEKKGREYLVKITCGKDEEFFKYSRTNMIFPYYNSLINTIRKLENCVVNLKTDYEIFSYELEGNLNKNTRMNKILMEELEDRNITLQATLI